MIILLFFIKEDYMKFSKVYEPRVGEYDKNGRLAPKSIISILEDAGAKHSASVNDDIIASAIGGVSWILVEWNIEIEKLPINGEKLYIDTWAISKKAEIITQREFEVKDQDGNVYIHACERLVLEDFNTGKLLRITPEMLNAYNPEEALSREYDLSKLKEPSEYKSESVLSVRKADIDYNNHVHNTHYVDYALEILPECEFKGYRVLYKKPLFYGENATLKYDGDSTVGIYNTKNELCTLVKFKK